MLGVLGRLVIPFGIMGSAATLLSLVLPGAAVFLSCSLLFTSYAIWQVFREKVFIGRIAIGPVRTLDLLAEIINRAKEQDVFVYAAYNATDMLADHPYMRRTLDLLQDSALHGYTRIVALRSESDFRLTETFLRRFGRTSLVRIGVHTIEKAIPLNAIFISPSHVVLGLPKEPAGKNQSGDAIAIYLRSRIIYEAFSMFRTSLWTSSVRLTGDEVLNDEEVELCVGRLNDLRSGSDSRERRRLE
jgi:hypothetical protein